MVPAGGSRSWEGAAEPRVPEGIGFIPLSQPSAMRGEGISNLVVLRGPGMCHLSALWSRVVCGGWYSPACLGKGLCPLTFGRPTSEALMLLRLSPDPQSSGGSPHWPQSPRSQLQVSSPVVVHPFPGLAPRHPAAPVPAPSLFWEENSLCLAPCSHSKPLCAFRGPKAILYPLRAQTLGSGEAGGQALQGPVGSFPSGSQPGLALLSLVSAEQGSAVGTTLSSYFFS